MNRPFLPVRVLYVRGQAPERQRDEKFENRVESLAR